MNRRIAVLVAAIALVSSMTAYALRATSHMTFKNRDSATEFCNKCHSGVVGNVTHGAHSPANCICHGYNLNETYPLREVNLRHGLTKDIYCTNCHSDSDENGDITIQTAPYISGLDQTAHYLIKDDTDTIYANGTSISAGYWTCVGCHSEVAMDVTLVPSSTYNHSDANAPQRRY